MVYVINPIDPTIKSLRRLVRYLEANVKGIEVIFVCPGKSFKETVHRKISKIPLGATFIFMGHGRSDALFGSRGIHWNAMIESDDDDVPVEYYNDEKFIDKETYGLFDGKRLVLFACNSVDLGETLIEHGASVALGFDRLPTTKDEFQDDWNIHASVHLIAAMNGCLNVAFRNAMVRACNDNITFARIESLMRMELQRQIVDVLTSRARYRYDLANVLSHVKRNLRVEGDRKLKLE